MELRPALWEIIRDVDYTSLIALLANGRARGSPLAPSLVAEGRRLLVKLLVSLGAQGELPAHPRPGQCFLIEALGELLRILGDPG